MPGTRVHSVIRAHAHPRAQGGSERRKEALGQWTVGSACPNPPKQHPPPIKLPPRECHAIWRTIQIGIQISQTPAHTGKEKTTDLRRNK